MIGAAALMVAGCASTGPKFSARDSTLSVVTNLTALAATNQIEPGWLRPSTNLFTLGPGDRLDIEVMDDATTRATVLVGPDGKVYYYLLPGLDVWGLTLAQAKTLLEHELNKYIRSQPRLAVTAIGALADAWNLSSRRRDDLAGVDCPRRRPGQFAGLFGIERHGVRHVRDDRTVGGSST
jgi:hypothetical protein